MELKVLLAGSYPSGKEKSKDIDIIIVVNRDENINNKKSDCNNNIMNGLMNKIVGSLQTDNILVDVLSQGSRNLMGYINLDTKKNKLAHLDLKLVSKYNFPFTYLHFTSGVDFNRYIRTHANKLNYSLSDLGLFRDNVSHNNVKEPNRIPNTEFDFDDDIIRYKINNEKKIFDYLGLNYVSIKNRR